MANKCTWWQFHSALVHMVVYQISKGFPALVYMQHKHMVYRVLHRHHYLVLDQNANGNSYSTPFLHEIWNVEHKIVMLVIDLYLIIILNIILSVCPFHFMDLLLFLPWSNTPFFRCSFVIWCWNSLSKLTSYFLFPVCIFIWESNLFYLCSWTVDTNWYI